MPSTSDLYVVASNMLEAFAASASSSESGHPKENLMDWNPNTYWKAAGVGTVDFVIDLASAKNIQGWGLWLHNAHVDLSVADTQQIKVYYSATGAGGSWTLWDTVYIRNTFHQPIFFGTAGLTAQLKRYWKFEIIAPDTVVEVSMVYLYTKLSLTQGNQRPETSVASYAVRKWESPSGQVYTSLIRSTKRERLSRTYLFCTAGAWDSIPLVVAFHDHKGNWRPLLLVEDGDKTLARLVRFAQPDLQKVEDATEVYRVAIDFMAESYVAPGKTL